ncbi:MAG: sulfatase family protein [Planctomycetota bacterium]|jgi:arylsulfatase A-like enzyme
MKNVYLRNSGLNRIVPFLAILLLVVLGLSVFLLTRLRTDRAGSSTRGPVAIHLVKEFKPENVEGTSQEMVTVSPQIEWRFDGSTPSPSGEANPSTLGWQAGPGVADFQVRDGRLTGRTTSDCPIIYAERTSGLDDPYQICAFEIRMRVSAGADLAVTNRSSEKLDLEEIAELAKEGRGFFTAAPIATDNEMHTYTFRIGIPESSSDIGHVVIRPTDAQGATFEIEFVRLLTRREYFASNSRLVSWEGLAGIYHQTLVTTTAEVIRFPMSLPDRPWLDLALGTIEDGPVTFQVRICPAGGRAEDAILLARTLTTPRRWEHVQVDLSGYATEDVILSLSLAAEKEGTLGFWGSPVIRNSGAIPPPAISDSDAFSREIPQGVILIWADALRWDHLNVYGYPRETAPVLSRMAAEGALFHDCLSQATWTLPSTSSLLTSLYVTTHGVMDAFRDTLPVTATIMPEVFHDAGYATLSFSSVWFTGRYFNMHQGFDELHEYDSLDWAKPNSSKTAREYVNRLLPWLEAHREVPFFVFLHVFDPHTPYEPYPPYDTLWIDPARKKEPEIIVGPFRKKMAFTLKKLKEAGIDLDEFFSLSKDWYDGSIRAMDAEIGRLFERLEELGLDDKTLVIFISDHGEEFLDHGGMGHATTVYSEQTHVPLIVRWPGVVPEGAEVFETVRTIDLMPTILELCRLPVPEAVQGQSLVPLLTEAKGSSSEPTARSDRNGSFTTGQWRNESAVSELLWSEQEKRSNPEQRDSYACISDGWKLIHNIQPSKGHPEYELYDNRKDPLDKINLADKHPEIVERLAEQLKAWKEKAAAERLTPDSEQEKKLTPEQLQHLRSLGYIR